MDASTLPDSLGMLLPIIAVLVVFGVVQAWRTQNGTTTGARLATLEEELDRLRTEHEELQARVRLLERADMVP